MADNRKGQMLVMQPLEATLLPAAVALDQQVFGGFWSCDSYRQELERSTSDLLGLWTNCLLKQPLLGMGCSWAILDEAHITLLAIHPAYQGQGLGQALLYGLLKIAQIRGLSRATLEVRASNQAALNLYQKFGFQVIGRRKRYYAATGEDALVLWLGQIQSPQFAQHLHHCEQHLRDRLGRHGWDQVQMTLSLP